MSVAAYKDALAGASFDDSIQRIRPVELPPLPENPKVSVLVANHNYGDYIEQAIISVLDQSYSNLELIICDDGSTDHSCEVIQRHMQRDSRVRLLRQPQSGQAAALNTAYRESSGEIICLLDSDDRYLPGKLDTVISVFRAHPQSGFLAHKIFQVDKNGRRIGNLPPFWDPPSGWYGESVLQTGDPPPGLVPTSGLCMRRRVADLLHPLPQKMVLGVDTAICCLAPFTTRLIGVPVSLAEYRYHGKNGFAPSRVNEQALCQLLEFQRASWKAQREYLERVHTGLAEIFPPLEGRLSFQTATYVLARLTKDPGAVRAHRDLMHNVRLSSSSFLLKSFWACSIFLPLPLFRSAVDFMWARRSAGAVNRLILRVLRAVHMRASRPTHVAESIRPNTVG